MQGESAGSHPASSGQNLFGNANLAVGHGLSTSDSHSDREDKGGVFASFKLVEVLMSE